MKVFCFIAQLLVVLNFTSRAQSTLVTNVVDIPIINCSGLGQLCETVFETTTLTASNLWAQYHAGAGHCSEVRAHYFLDHTEIGASDWLTTEEATGFVKLGPVPPGAHIIGIQLEGRVGGCNGGAILSWAGVMDIVTDNVSVETRFLSMSLTASLLATAPIGSTNRIEYTADLTARNWQTLTNLVITQRPQPITDPDGTTNRPTRYYRLVDAP